MQYYYDKCLPGNSTILNEYDAVTMQIRENSLNVKDCVLDMSKSVPLPRESETTLKPVIRTAAEKPRKPGLLENLVAMIKRNFNSPKLVGVVDIEDTASLLVDKFFDAYLIKEKKKTKKYTSAFKGEFWKDGSKSKRSQQLASWLILTLLIYQPLINTGT